MHHLHLTLAAAILATVAGSASAGLPSNALSGNASTTNGKAGNGEAAQQDGSPGQQDLIWINCGPPPRDWQGSAQPGGLMHPAAAPKQDSAHRCDGCMALRVTDPACHKARTKR